MLQSMKYVSSSWLLVPSYVHACFFDGSPHHCLGSGFRRHPVAARELSHGFCVGTLFQHRRLKIWTGAPALFQYSRAWFGADATIATDFVNSKRTPWRGAATPLCSSPPKTSSEETAAAEGSLVAGAPSDGETQFGGEGSGSIIDISGDDSSTPQQVRGSSSSTVPAVVSDDPFRLLSRLALRALVKSDLKRIQCNDGASTGWTAWIDESAAEELRIALGSINLSDPTPTTEAADVGVLDIAEDQRVQLLKQNDEVRWWTKWMKSAPAPMVIELSREMRAKMGAEVTDEELELIDSSREDLLNRAGCRLYLLPSGSTLRRPLQNPPGTMVYGKLLFGGVMRFRLLSGGRHGRPRKVGERTVIHGGGGRDAEEGWLQYGGPERNYQAVDMGPCAFLELIILPTGLALPSVGSSCNVDAESCREGEMAIDFMSWDSSVMFGFGLRSDAGSTKSDETKSGDIASNKTSASTTAVDLIGLDRNEDLRDSLSSAVGGLRKQVDAIVRRVLDGRAVVATPGGNMTEPDNLMGIQLTSAMEAAELAALGLRPVRGLLLYGPPGCGKTAIAREISKALHARPPKIVDAPELLDRWVGGSEKLVRSLFVDAEEELRTCGGDSSKSALHVIVIDEIDAVFRKRSASEDGGEATRASAVNQILAKLDGVEQIPNVLLIGMTNRMELLDEALLRPGRLEVKVKIPLPDQEGRREILQIHFHALRKRGKLSRPLCDAIDGGYHWSSGSEEEKNEGSFLIPRASDFVPASLRFAQSKLPFPNSGKRRVLKDLSADYVTGGLSGADLAGMVRCAGSIALSRARERGDGIEGMVVTLEDVADALEEVKQ